MASGPNVAYDSDQESIDLNEFPNFGMEHGGNAETHLQSSAMGMASLLDAECAEMRTDERMEEIAKEMHLFTLDETEGTKLSFIDVKEKHTELQPPAIPFFTSSHHHIYSPDSLVWPFSGNKDAFANFSFATIRKHVMEGYFERQYVSRKKYKRLLQYLFHIMSSTKDAALMHCASKTLTYMIDVNSMNVNIMSDILLALANLGGDISKLGKDMSAFSSPVIPHFNSGESDQEKPRGMFKENKTLILKFLNVHLSKSSKYSPSDLDDLLNIFLAIALDPLILDSGIIIHVSNGINQILGHYPSSQIFIERMPNLVKHIAVHCDFHHHTVAYLCVNYILPIQKHGQMLRSSLAFRQAEMSLQKEMQDAVLQYVLVEDVLELVIEQHYMFSEETDSYLLLSVMTLLDICISDEPLHSDQRAKLQELCSIIEPTIKRRKGNIDDQHTLHLDHFTDRLMIKWKQKAGHVKRQQTLMELKANYPSVSQHNSSTGLQAIQANYSGQLE